MIAWKCPKADYLTVRPWPNAVTHLDCLQPAQPSAYDPKRTPSTTRCRLFIKSASDAKQSCKGIAQRLLFP